MRKIIEQLMKVRSGILVTAFAPGYRHFHLKHNNNYVDGKYHDFVLLVKIQDESIVFVGFSFDVFDGLLTLSALNLHNDFMLQR